MDGLMFNTEDIYWQVGSAVLRRRGCEFTKALSDQMMGLRPEPAFGVMIRWHNLADSWQQLARESEEVFIGLLDDQLTPMPGLLRLLDRLEQSGVPKAVGTSSARELTHAVLSRFQLEPRFQFILSAEDIVEGKPHPEIYLTAARRLGIAPAEMLVLEDSHNGCRAAAAAGALTVAVPGQHSREHDFSVATLQIESLADPRLYRLLGIDAHG
jgi:HAD superfamily hydrolase (TIGR01509 family)